MSRNRMNDILLEKFALSRLSVSDLASMDKDFYNCIGDLVSMKLIEKDDDGVYFITQTGLERYNQNMFFRRETEYTWECDNCKYRITSMTNYPVCFEDDDFTCKKCNTGVLLPV